MKGVYVLFWSLVLTFLVGCSAWDCPTQPLVKLKKTPAHRYRYYRHLQKEKALARESATEYEAMRRLPREGKKQDELDSWDCPRPGTTKHQRLIREKRRKLDKMHDKKKSENTLDDIAARVGDSETQ